MDLTQQTENIERLMSLAQNVFKADGADDVTEFLDAVTVYLDEFDAWQANLGQPQAVGANLSEDEKTAFKATIEQLQAAHSRVIELSTKKKGLVADEMSGLHKRATAMKKYIDRYPSRITITGKREG